MGGGAEWGWLRAAAYVLPWASALLPGWLACSSGLRAAAAPAPELTLTPTQPRRCRPAGHQLGTIGSYLLCPLLISQFGWESVFWIFGSLGFVWLLGWQPLVSDHPSPAATSAADSSNGTSLAQLPAGAANKDLRVQDVPWADFAKNKAFWAIVAAQCTVSVGNVLAFRSVCGGLLPCRAGGVVCSCEGYDTLSQSSLH